MTKEEEAIEYIQKQIDYYKEQIKFIEAVDSDYYDEEYELYKNRIKQFETVLNMLKEKDKMIDLLAEKLGEITIKICPYDELKIDCSANSKNYWIEYFKQKATKMSQEGE